MLRQTLATDKRERNVLPPVVAGVAGGLLADKRSTQENNANIRRLITDHRMGRVWRELYKKTARGGYRHPAQPDAQSYWMGTYGKLPDGEYSLQDLAVGMFLFSACLFSALGETGEYGILTQAEYRVFLEGYADHATRLRYQAAVYRTRFGLNPMFPREAADVGAEEHAQAIERAADFIEQKLNEIKQRGRIVVTRIRGNRRARAYVVKLVEMCQYLFGENLHGTIATTASVALQQKILRQTVREWCRSRGAGIRHRF
jgi:hypothetical protein